MDTQLALQPKTLPTPSTSSPEAASITTSELEEAVRPLTLRDLLVAGSEGVEHVTGWGNLRTTACFLGTVLIGAKKYGL